MILPPAIRVFVSSTFSDMKDERNILNERIFLKVKRYCEDKGVSFFPIELRWGITEEEQQKGNVLPICLSEIDKSRPFFIGLIGERYGSVVQSIDKRIMKQYPWISNEHIGLSYTEIEMLYGVLNAPEKIPYSAFYIRNKKTDGNQPDDDAKLEALKKKIYECPGLRRHEYNSHEEFERQVLIDLTAFVDELYPSCANMDEIKQEWYANELRRAYVPNDDSLQYLDNYMKNIGTPLLLYGAAYSGKTTLLTNWIRDKEIFSVIINCNADDKYRHWNDIAVNIIQKIIKKYPGAKYPDVKTDIISGKSNYILTDHGLNAFQAAFVEWLSTLELSEDIAIVLNDVQLIYDNGISKYFGWLPNSTKEHVHLFVSTNEDAAINVFKMKEWNFFQMKPSLKDQTRTQIKTYLSYYGKQLSDVFMDKIINTHIGDLPGLTRFVIHYLITSADFNSIQTEIDKLNATKSVFELLNVIYNSTIVKLGDELKEVLEDFLCLLSISRLGLDESDVYAIMQKSHNIDMLTWAKLITLTEPFMDRNKNQFSIQSKEVISFINETIISPKKKLKAHIFLGEFHMNRLFESDEDDLHTISRPERIKICAENSVEMLWHLVQAEAWPVLYNCMRNGNTLYYLSMLNWNTVRYVWLNLIINTDYSLFDAYKVICEKCKSYIEEVNEDNEIFNEIYHRILSLCVDMDISSEAARLSGDDKSIYGSSDDLRHFITTESFTDFNNDIVKLNLMGEYNEVISLVEKNIINYNDIEKALLLLIAGQAAVNSGLIEKAEKYADMVFDIVIRFSDVNLLARALYHKADVLLRKGLFKKSLDMFNQTKMIFFFIGKMDYYLVSELSIARIMGLSGQYDEAEALYKRVINIYKKTNNKRNFFTAMQNLGCFYYSNKLYKEAYNIFIEISSEAKEDKDQNLYGKLLNNIALCAGKLGNNEEAESCFIAAYESAREMDIYGDIHTAVVDMILFYEENYLFTKALKYINEMQDYLISKGKYDALNKFISNEIEDLSRASLLEKAKERTKYWEEFFMNLGNDGYKTDTDSGRDYAKLVQKEKLFLATKSIDELLVNYEIMIYKLYDIGSFEEAVEVSRKAINAAKEYNKPDFCQEFLKIKLTVILQVISSIYPNKSVLIVDPDDYKQFIDADVAAFYMLWNGIFTDLDGKNSAGAEEKMFNIFALKPVSAMDYHLIFAMSMGRIIMNHFSYNLFERIFYVIDSNINLKETKKIKAALLDPAFRKAIQDVLIKKEDYIEDSVKEFVNNCELLIRSGIQADHCETAGLAGNLALIYRRMKNKEKTFEMHELSVRLYEAADKIKDSLIEMMNLSTAFKEFGDNETALDKLRETRQKAYEAKEEQIHASVCGNIAALLDITQGVNAIDEIEDMFKKEEQFFRKYSEYRELVISLLNQASFYLKTDVKAAIDKMNEASTISQENNLWEFNDKIRQLLRQIMPDYDENFTDKQNLPEVIIDMINQIPFTGNIQILNQDDVLCTITFDYNDEKSIFYKHSMVNVQTGAEAIVGFMVSVSYKQTGKDLNESLIDEYIKLINETKDYSLSYNSENESFIFGLLCDAKDHDIIQVISFSFNAALSIWEREEAVLTGIILGKFTDIDDINNLLAEGDI